MILNRNLVVRSSLCLLLAAVSAGAQQPQYPNYPSETPQHFQQSYSGWDYTWRDVMIPMRDGVRLHAVVLLPKGAHNAPILLTRTPYSASRQAANLPSVHLDSALYGYDNATDVIVEGGYIRVVQDIRGKYGSEGDLRDEPAAARAAESHAGRRIHRHLRHHRLAGKEHSREQRQGGHSGHLLRRISAADGAGESASGAEGGGADESDGGWLDGRRLVPQRRLSPTEHALHLRAGRHARERRPQSGGPQHYDDYDDYMRGRFGGRTGPRARAGADGLLAEDHWSTRATTPSGASRRWTRCWPRSR